MTITFNSAERREKLNREIINLIKGLTKTSSIELNKIYEKYKTKLLPLIENESEKLKSDNIDPFKDLKTEHERMKVLLIETKNVADKSETRLRTQLPELIKLNKKVGHTGDTSKILKFLVKAHETSINTISTYEDYVIYLIQRKLGLVKGSVPGANKIEKELGLK